MNSSKSWHNGWEFDDCNVITNHRWFPLDLKNRNDSSACFKHTIYVCKGFARHHINQNRVNLHVSAGARADAAADVAVVQQPEWSNRQLITALDFAHFYSMFYGSAFARWEPKPYQYAKCDFSAMANGTRCQMCFCEKNTNFWSTLFVRGLPRHIIVAMCCFNDDDDDDDKNSSTNTLAAIQSVPQITKKKKRENIECTLVRHTWSQVSVRHILFQQIKICNVFGKIRAVCKWKCYYFYSILKINFNFVFFFSFRCLSALLIAVTCKYVLILYCFQFST